MHPDAQSATLLRTFLTAPRRVALRTWMFYLHLISGVAFGLYFALIGVSGSIIVFEPELSDLTMPPAANRPADATPLPLNEIVRRVHEAYPGRAISLIRWYPEPEDRYKVRLKATDPGGVDTYAYSTARPGSCWASRRTGSGGRWICTSTC